VLGPEQVEAPFEHNLDAVKSTTELWGALLLLAVLLLPFDVGVRRLSFSRDDVRRALAAVARKMGVGAGPVPAVPQASSPEIAALFSARERVREEIKREPEGTLPTSPSPGGAANPNLPSWAQDLQLGGRMGRNSTPLPTPQPAEPQPPVLGEVNTGAEDTLASRLRKAREQR
jgi:hypothetical protein